MFALRGREAPGRPCPGQPGAAHRRQGHPDRRSARHVGPGRVSSAMPGAAGGGPTRSPDTCWSSPPSARSRPVSWGAL